MSPGFDLYIWRSFFNRTFIGERTISRNSMLNAGPEDLSSQDAAEKKSCFETEFQVVSCYSLVNEKRSSKFELYRPSCYEQNCCRTCHDASANRIRFQEIIRTVLDGNFPAFVKRFASLCRCFAILAACNMAKQK